jgi:hypothetical protein
VGVELTFAWVDAASVVDAAPAWVSWAVGNFDSRENSVDSDLKRVGPNQKKKDFPGLPVPSLLALPRYSNCLTSRAIELDQ